MYIYVYKDIIIIPINFVTAAISLFLNVAGDLVDLQSPPQSCSIKSKTDSDNIEIDINRYKSFIFTNLSHLVCFVHLSDIKPNWSQVFNLFIQYSSFFVNSYLSSTGSVKLLK